jgi:hypothetical protein
VLGQVRVHVGHELVERDRKSGGCVERGDVGDITLDQNGARIANPLQRSPEDARDLAVEILPEMLARDADAQAPEAHRRELRRAAGDDAVDQDTIGDAARHRRGGVTGV